MAHHIELRSDTFTTPSEGMRRAMAAAAVGDDVWGEDPTVIQLQERVAELLGKEAGLFVPSGSMANQIALLVHTSPGDLVLHGWGSHCVAYEAGAGAALAGAMFQALGLNGMYTAQDLVDAIPPPDLHFPQARLAWLENTHNQASGQIFPQDDLEAIADAAHERGLAVHLDGARLLNAAVASERAPREILRSVDSTSICLSKGLGAPVGSVLAGSTDFVARARRYRKMLGGAMRQVGVLAAGGLYALEHNVERLAEDHANARLLAERLATIPGIELDAERVQTNIIIFELSQPAITAQGLIAACAEHGLRLSPAHGGRVRAVTHLDVSREDCAAAGEIVRDLLRGT